MSTLIAMSLNQYSTSVAALAVDGLQRARRAANVSQRELAEEMGVTRQPVNQKLQAGDMKLTEFVTMALSVGVEPADLFAQAKEKAALAGREVE